MTDPRTGHWTGVYETKGADTVSWYQPQPRPSLEALERLNLDGPRSLIDVGGGASSLVDNLLDLGWSDLTVLDIAGPALEVSRQRLGSRAKAVSWIAADITRWRPERTWEIWHDRAVFHFLTEADDRAAYRRALTAGLSPGGHLIMATFAPDGPERCSGLIVQRYDAESLAQELGEAFNLIDHWREVHTTPGGGSQNFSWAMFERYRA